MLTEEQKRRTIERFERHRAAWACNPFLRELYRGWYQRIRAELPAEGPWMEIGSGAGFARELLPGIELTDVVKAPWHDREAWADRLPVRAGSLGGLVLFDVLHHLAGPSRFLAEASRVLRRGGRVVLCEPYVSPLSWLVYRFLHPERLDLAVDPLALDAGDGKDPFDSNQAIPTVLFGRDSPRLRAEFPDLSIEKIERLAGPSYVASGGLSRAPLLPAPLWRTLLAIEDRLPEAAFRLIGFRMLVVIEKR